MEFEWHYKQYNYSGTIKWHLPHQYYMSYLVTTANTQTQDTDIRWQFMSGLEGNELHIKFK